MITVLRMGRAEAGECICICILQWEREKSETVFVRCSYFLRCWFMGKEIFVCISTFLTRHLDMEAPADILQLEVKVHDFVQTYSNLHLLIYCNHHSESKLVWV